MYKLRFLYRSVSDFVCAIRCVYLLVNNSITYSNEDCLVYRCCHDYWAEILSPCASLNMWRQKLTLGAFYWIVLILTTLKRVFIKSIMGYNWYSIKKYLLNINSFLSNIGLCEIEDLNDCKQLIPLNKLHILFLLLVHMTM